MEKLYEKLDNLKKELDNTNTIKEIKKLIKEIQQNKDLTTMIEKYRYTQNERIKQQIINNDLFKEYKHKETDLNFLILEINQELKKITKKDKCNI